MNPVAVGAAEGRVPGCWRTRQGIDTERGQPPGSRKV